MAPPTWVVRVVGSFFALVLSSCWSGGGPVSPISGPEDRISSPVVASSTVPADVTTNTAGTTGTVDTDHALNGTLWQLVSLNGEQLADDTIITLEIDEDIDEVMTGDLVCNSYGLYATFADDGTIVPRAGTAGERWVMSAAGCTTASLTLDEYNDLSDRYSRMLTDATSYEVEGDSLRLSTPDGQTLVYHRV